MSSVCTQKHGDGLNVNMSTLHGAVQKEFLITVPAIIPTVTKDKCATQAGPIV